MVFFFYTSICSLTSVENMNAFVTSGTRARPSSGRWSLSFRCFLLAASSASPRDLTHLPSSDSSRALMARKEKHAFLIFGTMKYWRTYATFCSPMQMWVSWQGRTGGPGWRKSSGGGSRVRLRGADVTLSPSVTSWFIYRSMNMWKHLSKLNLCERGSRPSKWETTTPLKMEPAPGSYTTYSPLAGLNLAHQGQVLMFQLGAASRFAVRRQHASGLAR